MLLDDIIPDIAFQVLQAVGGSGTLSRMSSAYNLTTGVTTAKERISYSVTVSPPINYTAYERNDASIQKGDFKIYLAAEGMATDPAPEDVISLGLSKSFRVVNVDKIMSGLLPALFICQCRY